MRNLLRENARIYHPEPEVIIALFIMPFMPIRYQIFNLLTKSQFPQREWLFRQLFFRAIEGDLKREYRHP